MAHATKDLMRKAEPSQQQTAAGRETLFSYKELYHSKRIIKDCQTGFAKSIPVFFSSCLSSVMNRKLFIKTISLTLAFCLIFSSVAPSYAEALDRVRMRRVEARVVDTLMHAVSDGSSMPRPSAFEALNEDIIYWSSVMDAARAATEAYHEDSCYRWVDKLYREQVDGRGVWQAGVLDLSLSSIKEADGKEYNTLEYLQACNGVLLEGAIKGGGVKGAINQEYYKVGSGYVGVNYVLAGMIGKYGLPDYLTGKGFEYLKAEVLREKACRESDLAVARTVAGRMVQRMKGHEVNGVEEQRKEATARCITAGKAMEGMVSIAAQDSGYEREMVKTLGKFIENRWKEPAAAGQVHNGVMLLLGWDSEEAYKVVLKFITEQSRPTVGAALMDVISVPFEPFTRAAEVGQFLSTDGKYYNSHTVKYSYEDKEKEKAWGIGEVCSFYGQSIEAPQCPVGNLYEDLGEAIADQAVRGNVYAQQLARRIWGMEGKGMYPRPLVVGLLTGVKGAWTVKYGGAAGQEYLRQLMGKDYMDLNEGSQRRLHERAAVAAMEQHFIGGVDLGQYKKADKAKQERYYRYEREQAVLSLPDVVVQLAWLPRMLSAVVGVAGALRQVTVRVWQLKGATGSVLKMRQASFKAVRLAKRGDVVGARKALGEMKRYGAGTWKELVAREGQAAKGLKLGGKVDSGRFGKLAAFNDSFVELSKGVEGAILAAEGSAGGSVGFGAVAGKVRETAAQVERALKRGDVKGAQLVEEELSGQLKVAKGYTGQGAGEWEIKELESLVNRTRGDIAAAQVRVAQGAVKESVLAAASGDVRGAQGAVEKAREAVDGVRRYGSGVQGKVAQEAYVTVQSNLARVSAERAAVLAGEDLRAEAKGLLDLSKEGLAGAREGIEQIGQIGQEGREALKAAQEAYRRARNMMDIKVEAGKPLQVRVEATGAGQARGVALVGKGKGVEFELLTEEARQARLAGVKKADLKYSGPEKLYSEEALAAQGGQVAAEPVTSSVAQPVWRKGVVRNRLGQEVMGYVEVNPKAVEADAPWWKGFGSQVKWQLGQARYAIGNLGKSLRSWRTSTALATVLTVTTPAPALGIEAVSSVGKLLKQSEQVVNVVHSVAPVQEVATVGKIGSLTRVTRAVTVPVTTAARAAVPSVTAGGLPVALWMMPVAAGSELFRVPGSGGYKRGNVNSSLPDFGKSAQERVAFERWQNRQQAYQLNRFGLGSKQWTLPQFARNVWDANYLTYIAPLQLAQNPYYRNYQTAISVAQSTEQTENQQTETENSASSEQTTPAQGMPKTLLPVDLTKPFSARRKTKTATKSKKQPQQSQEEIGPLPQTSYSAKQGIPVYVDNHFHSYWMPDEKTFTALSSLKNNQQVFITVESGKKLAEMNVRTYLNEEKTKYTDNQVRSDIEVNLLQETYKPTSFGWKKIWEGVLLINNKLIPLYGLYLMAGMGNVSSTISNFSKVDFSLANWEMYAMGGVSSVVMGLASFVVGLLQQRWSQNPDGTVNGKRGRNITMNIGMTAFILAMIAPMLAGMHGQLGAPTDLKKYVLIGSFALLGIGAAFMDVSMKPVVLAASKRGDYQATQGYLSVFKQTVGNAGNYLTPPIAMAVMSMFGKMADWTVFFPIYGALGLGISLVYNLSNMHQQTLELSEMAPKKKIPTFKTFVQPGKNIWERFVGPFFGQVGYQLKKFFHTDELTGKQSYHKIIRHGVAATALHGMNMSILGLYVNQLFVDHVGGSFDMYANAGSSNVFAAVWESLSHSWLGQSLLFFTVPIIIGRFVGTYMMKHDMKIGNITIPRLNNGSLLIASTVMTIAGVAAIAFGTWPVKLVGVVAAALGLTNVSPIVGGFTADRTRHVSDAVSTLLSATSLIAFGGNLLFGWLKDLTDATIAPWLPLLMPVACLAYLGYFGWEIATRRFDKEVSEKKTEDKKTTAQNKTKSKKLLGIGALLAGGLGLSYLLGGLPGLGGGAVLAGGLPFLAKPQINEKKEKITKRNLSEKLAAEQISAQGPVVLSAKEKLAKQFDNWFDENEHFVANDETKAALRMVRDNIASLSSVEDAARVDLLMKKITEMPLGEKQPGEVTKIIFKAESLSDISADDFFVQREIRGIPSQWLSFKVPSTISLVPGKDGFSLKEIKMGKTATDLQLRNVLTDIASKSGFEIRMGAHELGITSSGARKYREGELHVHFESPLPNVNAEYYNYILSIDMGKLVHGKKAEDLQALYTKYFGRFLTEDIILWPSEKRSSYTNVWAQSIALLAIGWGLSQLVNIGTGLENAGLLLGAVPVLIHPSNIKQSNKPTVNWQDVSQAKMLNTSHLVWQLTDYQRNILGYAKFGTKRERERTKQFGQLMDLYGWQQKYNLFDISYPVVLEEGFEKLPSYLQRKIQHDREGVSLFGHVRSAWERSEVSFILSPVNIKGPNLRQWKDHPELIKEALRNIPITRQEWDQLISFFNELHGAGFEHTDLPNNLYISRNAQGKLQIALLDFEFLQHGTDDLSLEKWQQRLLKINMLEEKSENLVQGLFDFTFD